MFLEHMRSKMLSMGHNMFSKVCSYQAILVSSFLNLSILDLNEQSKNSDPAKIWSPPKIAEST